MTMTMTPTELGLDRAELVGDHPTRDRIALCVRTYLVGFDVAIVAHQAGELVLDAFRREGTLYTLDREAMVEVAAARGAALALALLDPRPPT